MSSDSSNTISTLDPNKAYIIGALVDHNRLKVKEWRKIFVHFFLIKQNKKKGVTFEKAQKQGIETAKLPIGEHVELNSRAVISVNQGKFETNANKKKKKERKQNWNLNTTNTLS